MEMLELSGSVEEIVFTNEDNGYTVCVIDYDGKPVTLVGIMPLLAEGEILTARGSWVNHEVFGLQFKVDSFEKKLPSDAESICRFLASGFIKGIGPVTARRIVERYGEDSFEVLENNPEWLADIKGMTQKRATAAGEDFRAKFGMRTVMLFCGEYFGAATSLKIYKKYGAAAVDIIKQNPYVLCDDIQGIGFEKVDSVALSLGLETDNPERLKNGIKSFLMAAAYKAGHCYLERSVLVEEAALRLQVSEALIDRTLNSLEELKQITATEGKIALTLFSKAEKYVAEKLLSLSASEIPFRIAGLDEQISFLEAKYDIEYAPKQKNAIKHAVSNGVTVITGGPGTGKTTVIKAILNIFVASGISFMLCAPTGRAAKRMSEASGSEAKTIHRLLETRYDSKGNLCFSRDESAPLPYNAIIVDEVSMVDVLLMESLLRAVRHGSYLILIGDADQLPPVGAGDVLTDVIDSGKLRVIKLDEIFRQAKESLIVVNAHKINGGELPKLDEKNGDFFFLQRSSPDEITSLVSSLCETRLPKSYNINPLDDIQVITPTRKGALGTAKLNVVLQQALNPPGNGKNEKSFGSVVFREGDKVMQTRNNYDIEWTGDGKQGSGIFNGDIGIIVKLDNKKQIAHIRFDERYAEYDYSLFEDLEHAYAITVHKSQGSEYPFVIMPIYDCPPMLMTRNLLYTAVTRAKRIFIGTGLPYGVARMVENDKKQKRNTTLLERLRDAEQVNKF